MPLEQQLGPRAAPRVGVAGRGAEHGLGQRPAALERRRAPGAAAEAAGGGTRRPRGAAAACLAAPRAQRRERVVGDLARPTRGPTAPRAARRRRRPAPPPAGRRRSRRRAPRRSRRRAWSSPSGCSRARAAGRAGARPRGSTARRAPTARRAGPPPIQTTSPLAQSSSSQYGEYVPSRRGSTSFSHTSRRQRQALERRQHVAETADARAGRGEPVDALPRGGEARQRLLADGLDLLAQHRERRPAQAAQHLRVAPLAPRPERAQLALDELAGALELRERRPGVHRVARPHRAAPRRGRACGRSAAPAAASRPARPRGTRRAGRRAARRPGRRGTARRPRRRTSAPRRRCAR